MKEEMESLANRFVEFMNLNSNLKRMDSVMISSSCKKMSRLEIIYTCISNLAKLYKKDVKETELSEDIAKYLQEENKNNTIYRARNEEVESRLQKVIMDADALARHAAPLYKETETYKLLLRALKD